MNDCVNEREEIALRTPKEVTLLYKDSYWIVATTKNHSSADFKVYELSCSKCSDECHNMHFLEMGYGDNAQFTHDIEKAATFMHGFIKWTGCCHFWLDEDGYVHVDGEEGIDVISGIFKAIYDLVDSILISH